MDEYLYNILQYYTIGTIIQESIVFKTFIWFFKKRVFKVTNCSEFKKKYLNRSKTLCEN